MPSASEFGSQHLGTFWLAHLGGASLVTVVPHIPATFRRVGSEATLLLTQAMALDDPTVVSQRFARGLQCYVAMVEDVLVSYGWVTFDREEIGEIGLHIHLAPGEAYIWDCGTLPTYRGQHLYPALLTYILHQLQAQGLRRVWIGTPIDNLASQKGMARAGFQPVADLILTRVLTIRKPWIRGRPGVPEDLVMDARRGLFRNFDQIWLKALALAQKQS